MYGMQFSWYLNAMLWYLCAMLGKVEMKGLWYTKPWDLDKNTFAYRRVLNISKLNNKDNNNPNVYHWYSM